MSTVPLTPKPGVNFLATRLGAEGTWWKTNLVRFKDGFLEKLGGWLRMSTEALSGICRGLLAFADLENNNYLGCGTTSNLELLWNGELFDITPVQNTTNNANNLSTVALSNVVAVHDVGAGGEIGNQVDFPSAVAIGGIVIQGFYPISNIIDADNYDIIVPNPATATVTNGGALPVYTTVATSNIINVDLDNHGQMVGNLFTVGVSTTVGGLTLFGPFPVDSVVDSSHFTIAAPAPAGSAASATENGGNIRIEYLIPSEAPGQVRNWFLDAWGQDLMGCYTGGPLYIWVPPVAPGNVATVISQAPAANNGFFIAMPEQIAVTLGCTDPNTGLLDPLFIRWSDVADFTDWTASATNQAGSFRLSRGSQIIGGLQGPLQAFIWTDQDMWVMQYQGFPLVFGFFDVGNNCGLLAPKAATKINSGIYWMSRKGFFMYNGSGVVPMTCPVWDFVFNNIDYSSAGKICCATNTEFDEVTWYFPVGTNQPGASGAFGEGEFGAGRFGGSPNASTNENSAYVKYNFKDNLWDFGFLARSAWVDQSLLGEPIGTDPATGLIQQHEVAMDADGFTMPSNAISGFGEMTDGQDFTFLERVLPNFKTSAGGSVAVTFDFCDYDDDDDGMDNDNTVENVRTYGPFVYVAGVPYWIVRGRGRFVGMTVDFSALNSFGRLGSMRRVQGNSGRRP